MERKSTLQGSIREELPSAESSSCENAEEVHPGADPVKQDCLAGYVRTRYVL